MWSTWQVASYPGFAGGIAYEPSGTKQPRVRRRPPWLAATDAGYTAFASRQLHPANADQRNALFVGAADRERALLAAFHVNSIPSMPDPHSASIYQLTAESWVSNWCCIDSAIVRES